jgi:sRNA-binding protein
MSENSKANPPAAPADKASNAEAKADKSDHLRGMKASREHVPALQERWPLAFPKDNRRVRPLANLSAPVAEAMGWTPAFATGVLRGWKARSAYCHAILKYPVRIDLAGQPTEQVVDDAARAMARSQLAAIKKRFEEREAKKLAIAAQPAPQAEPVKPPKPAPVTKPAGANVLEPPAEPKPAAPQVEVLETPEQIRAHLRASLLKRRA